MRRLRIICVLALSASLACESSTTLVATDAFVAGLAGAKVKPDSVTTSGSGALTITLKSNTSFLAYDLSFAGLSSAATSAHIHGPAADTATGDVLVDLAAPPQGGQGTLLLGTSGTATGSFDLATDVTTTVTGDSLFRLLHAGLLYLDVHTAFHSDGEIRGQIAKK